MRKALGMALFFAAIAGVAGLFYALPWTGASWQALLQMSASVGCFGFLLGGIFAFDPESEFKIKSSAIGRMVFGLAAALLLSALWSWPGDAVLLASMIGVALGYFGMVWAKYVDF